MAAVSCLDWGNRPLARSVECSQPSSAVVATEEEHINGALCALRVLVERPRAQSLEPSSSDTLLLGTLGNTEDEEHKETAKQARCV